MALDETVSVQSRSYTAPELCKLLNGATGSRAQFVAARSLEDQSVTLSESEVPIWELLERLYLDQGWEVDALDQTFTLRAPRQ